MTVNTDNTYTLFSRKVVGGVGRLYNMKNKMFLVEMSQKSRPQQDLFLFLLFLFYYFSLELAKHNWKSCRIGPVLPQCHRMIGHDNKLA